MEHEKQKLNKSQKWNTYCTDCNMWFLDRHTFRQHVKQIHMRTNATKQRKIYILAIGILAITSLYLTTPALASYYYALILGNPYGPNNSIQDFGDSTHASGHDYAIGQGPFHFGSAGTFDTIQIAGGIRSFNAGGKTIQFELTKNGSNPANGSLVVNKTGIPLSGNYDELAFSFDPVTVNTTDNYYFFITIENPNTYNTGQVELSGDSTSIPGDFWDGKLDAGGITQWSTNTNTDMGAYFYSAADYGLGTYHIPTSSIELILGTPSSTIYDNCDQYNVNLLDLFSSSTLGAIGCTLTRTFTNAVRASFVPSETSLNFLSSSTEVLQQAFPFNIMFTGAEGIRNISQSLNTTSTLQIPLLISNTSVPIFASSTLKGIIGENGYNLWYNFIRNLTWLGTGILIFKLVIL